MTKRLEICIEDTDLSFFEVTVWSPGPEPKWFRSSLTPKQITKIIELLTLLLNNPAVEEPPKVKPPAVGPRPEGEIKVSSPCKQLVLPSQKPQKKPHKIHSSCETPYDFVKQQLTRGISLADVKQKVIKKYGAGIVTPEIYARWQGPLSRCGLIPATSRTEKRKSEGPAQLPEGFIPCQRPAVAGMKESDCVEFQCRWQFSTGDINKAWEHLSFCRTCPNEKKRPDLEVYRKKSNPI